LNKRHLEKRPLSQPFKIAGFRNLALRYQIAPLTIDLGKGVNRRPSPYYGARVVLSMVLMG
ncbi:hypothetical protein, partial [Aeromonas veronii]|uniref:hypothetical protein n=1 Tax=Aeromonas veronii TaxID=654 RepID=UPI003D1C23F4